MSKKGLTLVEVMISFSIAFALIISLYSIVYWGTKVSDINQYYIDVNNILIFASNEILNNTEMYITYNPSNNTFSYSDQAQEMLRGKIELNNLTIARSRNYDVILSPIQTTTVPNVIEIKITVVWYYKGKRYQTSTSLLLSVFGLTNSFVPPIPQQSDIEQNNTN
ncbi:MAG: hypothetical protein ABDH21_06035 [bacterium]